MQISGQKPSNFQVIYHIDDNTGKAKGASAGEIRTREIRDIRDLVGTVKRENAAIGVFLTLEKPSRDMLTEAASSGFYHSPGWGKDYPRIQILTIEDLLHRIVIVPFLHNPPVGYDIPHFLATLPNVVYISPNLPNSTKKTSLRHTPCGK